MAYQSTSNFVQEVLQRFPMLSSLKRMQKLVRVPAVAWLRKKNKLAVLYKTRQVVVGMQTMFLGSASNNSSTVRPVMVTTKIANNVLVAVNKSQVPPNVAVGKDIDKSNNELKAFFCDNDGVPYDNETKVIVRLPVCSPIGPGAKIKTGTVDQGTYTSLEDTEGEYYPFWLESITKHDKELQTLLLATEALREYLPPRPALGHDYADTPFFELSPIDPDDEDLENEIEALTSECNAIAQANMAQQLSPRKSPQPSPRKNPINMDVAVDAEAEAVSITDKEQLKATLMAFGASYDERTKTVSTPVLSKFIEDIFSTTNKTKQQKKVTRTLSSIEDSLADGIHFLGRAAELPQFDPVTASYIAQALFSENTVESLDVNSSDGLVLPMLMPDSTATATAKADQAQQNVAEDALGEHASKRSKQATTFTSVNELQGTHTLMSTLANVIILLLLYFEFELEGSGSRPSIATYVVKLSKLITSKKARRFMKKNPALRLALVHYVFNQMSGLVTGFAQASQDVLITSAILQRMRGGEGNSSVRDCISSFRQYRRHRGTYPAEQHSSA